MDPPPTHAHAHAHGTPTPTPPRPSQADDTSPGPVPAPSPPAVELRGRLPSLAHLILPLHPLLALVAALVAVVVVVAVAALLPLLAVPALPQPAQLQEGQVVLAGRCGLRPSRGFWGRRVHTCDVGAVRMCAHRKDHGACRCGCRRVRMQY